MNDDEYTCASCGETFLKGRPDGEAMAETRARHGNVRQEDCEVVCDDCFNAMGLGGGLWEGEVAAALEKMRDGLRLPRGTP